MDQGMSNPHSEPPDRPFPRMVRRPGERLPAITRLERRPIIDLYHRVMGLPLWGVLVLMAATYLGINLVFGMAYLVAPGGVGNLGPGDFWNAFFFSVQTFGTIGYGYMFPRSFAADRAGGLQRGRGGQRFRRRADADVPRRQPAE